jgi:hypothetical protein
MPARDAIHGAVRNALIKDGWTITDDPCVLEHEDLIVFADLGADRSLAAERDNERVVVEAKTFPGRSTVYDLEHAIGQYLLYRVLLSVLEPATTLYLAITEDVHQHVFQRKGVDFVIEELGIKLLIVDPEEEVIVGWTR